MGSHAVPTAVSARDRDVPVAAWRSGLPVLEGQHATLRELRASDASNLYAALTTPEALKFMWAPPPNVVAFERFIEWTHAEREAGKYICFGMVPRGEEHAWGVFELRQLQPGFLRGELGFVIAPPYWGKGIFVEAARMLLAFAFDTVKVHRVEARVSTDNGRGNAAIGKIGFEREGTLRDAFWCEDHFADQYLWATLASTWRRAV